jgi:BrnA antitoxin of type II toxin-antitoxin system
MRKEYDFSKARRGAVIKPPASKTRITIRIDSDILEWFRSQVEQAGGGNYQTLLNDALRAHVEDHQESIEKLVRRVVREELKKAPAGRRPTKAA